MFKSYFKSFIVFLFFVFPSLVFADGKTLNTITFNILAPHWIDQNQFTKSTRPLLERTYRRSKIISVIQKYSNDTDIFALQETTETEFEYIKAALKDEFEGFQVYHDPSYWAHYTAPGQVWEPYGTALLLKKKVFENINFKDLPLGVLGNHAAYAEARVTGFSDLNVRSVSVHLDNDFAKNRRNEMSSVLAMLPASKNTIDIIAGDFNQNTQYGQFSKLLKDHHFVDVLGFLKRAEPTHPYIRRFSDWVGDDDILDHVIVRGAKPINGKVINFGLWNLFPTNKEARIKATFMECGSDHFPVSGAVGL